MRLATFGFTFLRLNLLLPLLTLQATVSAAASAAFANSGGSANGTTVATIANALEFAATLAEGGVPAQPNVCRGSGEIQGFGGGSVQLVPNPKHSGLGSDDLPRLAKNVPEGFALLPPIFRVWR